MNLLFDFIIFFTIIYILGKLSILKNRKLKDFSNHPFWVLVFLGPTLEEFVFRGIPLLFTSDMFSLIFVFSSVVFIFMHKDNYEYGFIYAIPIFLVYVFGFVYFAVTYGLMYAIGAHMINNARCYYHIHKS